MPRFLCAPACTDIEFLEVEGKEDRRKAFLLITILPLKAKKGEKKHHSKERGGGYKHTPLQCFFFSGS